MFKNILTTAACTACIAALSLQAGAAPAGGSGTADSGGIGRAAGDVADAGEDLIDGAIDAGEDIANDITGGSSDSSGTGGTSGSDSGNSDDSGSGSGTAGSSGSDTSGGSSDATGAEDNADENMPDTGVSFGFTAAAAVLGALGVVVTANRRD